MEDKSLIEQLENLIEHGPDYFDTGICYNLVLGLDMGFAIWSDLFKEMGFKTKNNSFRRCSVYPIIGGEWMYTFTLRRNWLWRWSFSWLRKRLYETND